MTELLKLPTVEQVEDYFRQRPYYHTDGKRFYANPSHRKAKGLHYIGRYLNAKEARGAYLREMAVVEQIRHQRGCDAGIQVDIFGNEHEYQSKPLEAEEQLTLDQYAKDKANLEKLT